MKAFVFSVNLQQKYPIKKNLDKATYSSSYAIYFGSAPDLTINEESNSNMYS